MTLVKIIAWLEIRRLRTQISLLILAILLAAAWIILGHSSQSPTLIDISLSSNKGYDKQLYEILASTDYLKLIYLLAKLSIFAGLGYIIMTLVPFRSDQEWHEGQFQMMRLSRWTTLQIQGVRLLLYMTAFWIFFTLLSVILITGMGLENISFDRTEFFWSIQIFTWAFCPLMLSSGQVIDALRTAYYQRGNKIPVTILQFLGWICLTSIFFKLFELSEEKLFPAFPLTSLEAVSIRLDFPLELHLEWVMVSLMLSVFLTLASGQILREVEA